jgi:hypothetical protein
MNFMYVELIFTLISILVFASARCTIMIGLLKTIYIYPQLFRP